MGLKKMRVVMIIFVSSVGSTHTMTTNEWCEDVKIADKTIYTQLNTGAKCNVIAIKDLQQLRIKANVKKVRNTTEVIF